MTAPRAPSPQASSSNRASSEPRTDAALLSALSEGDLGALGGLFDRYAADVHRFVLRAAPRHEPEDIVQETFLRLTRIASTFDGRSSSARAWILGVAHAIVRERRRAWARFARALAAIGTSQSDRVAHPTGGSSRDLEKALRSLGDDHREVVVLCELLGMTGPEAAEVLAVPVGTVWTRLHHARAALRRYAEEKP